MELKHANGSERSEEIRLIKVNTTSYKQKPALMLVFAYKTV